MALSKKDLVINITLNELYNTHSLILQHIEVLVSAQYMFGSQFLTLALCTSHRTRSSIFAFSQTSSVLRRHRFLARRTGQSSSSFTVAGRHPSRISRAR